MSKTNKEKKKYTYLNNRLSFFEFITALVLGLGGLYLLFMIISFVSTYMISSFTIM